MALEKKILLVTFGPSQQNHNGRLEKILRDTFTVEHFSFLETTAGHGKEFKSRVLISKILHLLSVPLLGALIAFQIFLFRIVLGDKKRDLLTEAFQRYFDDRKDFTTLVLHLNKTLRQQKIQVKRARRLIQSAATGAIDCVLLPEDSNYYASGIMITGLHEQGIKVGVVDYTIGKKAEFEISKNALVPDRNFLPYARFARLFLDSAAQKRWLRTKEFVNCFPGSLETNSYRLLTPSFLSGLADFYLSPDNSELGYLKEIANEKAEVFQIEPIELTLAKQDPSFGTGRNVFGVFLPPNQFTDPDVTARMSSPYSRKYEEMIAEILVEASEICDASEVFVVFPHPRTYSSERRLIDEISKQYNISNDYVDFLNTMKYALIFSSAVFSALIAANIKVFNLDIYSYEYSGVFPIENPHFIEITKINEIRNFGHAPGHEFQESHPPPYTVEGYLEAYLFASKPDY